MNEHRCIILVRWPVLLSFLMLLLLSSCRDSDFRAIGDDSAYSGIWAQEEAIERCMRERGFEYVAYFDPTDDLDSPELSPKLTEKQAVENPNEAILARMSQEERAAYDEAYWGASAFDSAGGGCLAIGAEEAYGVNLVQIVPDRTAIDAWQLAVREDHRVIAAEEQWRTCMDERGYVTASDRAAFYRELHLTADEFSRVAREQGVDRLELDGYSAYKIYYDGAFDADQFCRIDYDEVVQEVEDGYRSEFFNLGP